MISDTSNKPKVLVTRRLPEEVWGELVTQVEAELWDRESPPTYESILEKVPGFVPASRRLF